MTTSSPAPRADDTDTDRLRTLLGHAATSGNARAWSDLWTELYHNGSLDVAHPLVLPTLAGMAQAEDAGVAASALQLAGALLVQADQRYETRDLRQRYAPEVARMREAANRWRRVTADRDDYCYLVEALLNLEGDIHWAEDLIGGVVGEEYEVECPDPDGCATVWVAFGERGLFSTTEDYACAEPLETFPLHPADPRTLQGLGRRLYDLASADGHKDVARALTYAFGEATCPECEQRFSVAAQVSAR
ncbi:hypothetical protein [Streptomyces sp. NPDC047024]|uniref:hypothetical protein n=1 Tax=Streptomyces sp. NPDC047024 TaxID=3155476 RepID=UPI0033CCE451